ncbi:MAG: hypothetical protein RX318_07675 [bacterium]|nr:hypothetical protein [bacterium]
MIEVSENQLESTLYPKGTQFSEQELSVLMEQYKLFVDTSEKLVSRRQTVNTFFLSINALVLSGLGAIAKELLTNRIAIIGILAISIAGILLCIGWRRLVHTHRQLNAGKFAVIHLLEEQLPASLFKAEWEALGQGKDKKKYVPFTKTEATIPIIFIILYSISILSGIIFICN